MKFGIREICDVVLKAKANQRVGNKIFYKGEPVLYFDTLKTSTMEGAVTTVYAQGGRGNARLVAWDGERTVTFTMEDALISPEGLMILTGAGLIEGSETNSIPVHVAEQTENLYTAASGAELYIITDQKVSANKNADSYVMLMKNGEIISEPYIATAVTTGPDAVDDDNEGTDKKNLVDAAGAAGKLLCVKAKTPSTYAKLDPATPFTDVEVVTVDYYTDKNSGAFQVDITPDKFSGSYYLEASTLFRNTDGVDMPAEFIIPNCHIQSNFTFTMASSGDPSTFTFTMDAFPDYTKFNKTEKVFASIQVINEAQEESVMRDQTKHNPLHDEKVK